MAQSVGRGDVSVDSEPIPSEGPARRLGGPAAVALVAGSMLGIGIFITPPLVAASVSDPGVFFGVWILGGAAALLGATCLAELGAMMPRSGGDYNYLRIAYGNGIAFAAGWLQLLAIYPGSMASLAVAATSYQLPELVSFPPTWEFAGLAVSPSHVVAVGIILFLTGLNHLGIRISGRVQLSITGVPLLVLTVTSIWVLVGGKPGVAGLSDFPWGDSRPWPGLTAVALAYLPVYFAYSGWNNALYVGGEIRSPARNLPRALTGGTAIVTTLYMLLCAGFLSVFQIEGLAQVDEAGSAAATVLFGPAGRTVIVGLILLAMLGVLNGTVMAGSRIGYAMALNGDCIRASSRLSPRFGTPAAALWLQAAIALGLLATGSGLEQLIEYTSTAMLITGTLTVAAVVVLRRKLPRLERPYRAWLYPLSPLLYVLSSVGVLVLALSSAKGSDPSVFLAAAWFAGAWVVYWLRSRRSTSPPTKAAR